MHAVVRFISLLNNVKPPKLQGRLAWFFVIVNGLRSIELRIYYKKMINYIYVQRSIFEWNFNISWAISCICCENITPITEKRSRTAQILHSEEKVLWSSIGREKINFRFPPFFVFPYENYKILNKKCEFRKEFRSKLTVLSLISRLFSELKKYRHSRVACSVLFIISRKPRPSTLAKCCRRYQEFYQVSRVINSA